MDNLSNSVRRRLMARCKDDGVVVVVDKKGRPSRIFGIEEYLKMKQHPAKVKPWLFRKSNPAHTDPLGAVAGNVVRGLNRQAMYE